MELAEMAKPGRGKIDTLMSMKLLIKDLLQRLL
jgi:hypothetical protein